MKKLLFLIALALISPGLYEIGKAVQARRNADAQARYDVKQKRNAHQTRLDAEKTRYDELFRLDAEKTRNDEEAAIAKAERVKNTPRKQVWTYDPNFGWTQHAVDVSARQSRGGF